MSDGLKIGLIVAGVAFVGYKLLSSSSSATTAAIAAPPATVPATSNSPGSISAATVALAATGGILGTGAKAVYDFNKGVVVGFANLDKNIVVGTGKAIGSAASAVYHGVGNTASSIYHGIASIF